MKRLVFIIFMLLAFAVTKAQKDFQTIVTEGPIVAGESFQVQYVLEETDKDNEFFAPDFKEFRFVSGPNIYIGSAYGSGGTRKLKNIVYTLAANRPGKFIIPGASARIKNSLIKSGNVLLEVISKTEANNRRKKSNQQQTNEDSFLSPGEDPYAKIRRNLFMKVLVDKKNCFVGEPVTAIFKLYSRLNSKSDIMKNPGFYGFTVQDMINLTNRLTSNEIINGKEFDVHIVRKVQLYPLQAGLFSIDAMEVRNHVRFSKSAVNKKTEQEIVEGVWPGNDINSDENTIVFENSMATEPVAIIVKPTPQKNKPLEYNGATGNFKLATSLQKNEFAKNEEGSFVITISGKGNFTQLSPPVIQWPDGLEGFEPTVKDSLDHSQSPMIGKRDFHFRFVSTRPGNYDLPTVSFSFFNPDTNNYKTVSSGFIKVKVTTFEKAFEKVEVKDNRNNDHKKYPGLWIAGGGLAIAGICLFILKELKNKKKINQQSIPENNNRPTVSEILQPAGTFSNADHKTFYNILRNCIWNFFIEHFGLTGSTMNKSSLVIAMLQKGIDEENKKAILEILDQCETGIFTNVEDAGDKKKLLDETREALKKISNQFN
ncbi:MAG TPA: BatD family protein [Chitinophagaceae bacterium]|nr:BatD family protein [Chitinophagaceae bacterium]